MKEFNPEWAWVGGTVSSTAVILKDSLKLGLDTKFLINTWGMDENLVKLVGDMGEERAYGFVVVRPFGFDVPATKEIRTITGDKEYSLQFNKSWASMMVMWEGMKRAKEKDELNGPGLKAALETLRDFETGGLTPPLTYTPTDHRGTTTCGLYTIRDNALALVGDLTLKRQEKYLGW
jgi:branched-chain amino acid transport system substrate-binding protein